MANGKGKATPAKAAKAEAGDKATPAKEAAAPAAAAPAPAAAAPAAAPAAPAAAPAKAAPVKAAKVVKPDSGAVKAYKVLYNLACTVGWAAVAGKVMSHVAGKVAEAADGGPVTVDVLSRVDVSGVYADVGDLLKIVQTAAIMEIVHSATGLVRSPLLTTFLQGA